MIQKGKSRNADFILIARKGDTTTLGAKGPVKLKNLPAVRPVNPKNLSPLNPMNPHTGGVSKGEAGKGASAASQSAECLLCHMTLKANPVTLTS